MKVYVDKLPIKVRQSVIHYDDGKTNCLILEFSEDIKPSEICETKALKQQVIKEVCEEIRSKLDEISGEHEVKVKGGIGKFTCVPRYSLEQLLDQIQGE